MKSVEFFHLGQETHAFRYFGAHRSGAGYLFRLWAPQVARVSVTGDFNDWRLEAHPMHEVSPAIYECCVPEAQAFQCYKYAIEDLEGKIVYRADPYGTRSELRPLSASILEDGTSYDWGDQEFLKQRVPHDASQAINIYELHLGSWRRRNDGSFMNYDEIADELIPYLLDLHYTHVEFLPIQEHPLDASWGYQVSGYFAVTARYGTPQQFKNLINRLHQAGIAVILDWVPAHFPKDEQGLARFNGQALYEYPDEALNDRKTWGTLVFDYGRPEVCSFLLSNAFFWIEEYHVDGLRFAAIASVLYSDTEQVIHNSHAAELRLNAEAALFFRSLNQRLHKQHPTLLTIVDDTSNCDRATHPIADNGLGFSFKWNLDWMHETIDYFKSDYVHRPYQQQRITSALVNAFKERYLLPYSHDVMVHGKRSLIDKMPGDYWRKFASYRNLLAYQMTHPGPKLLFMGSEIAQFSEWHYYEALDWYILDYEMHRKLQAYVAHLNKLYKEDPVFWANDVDWSGFVWVEADDAERSVFSFIRAAEAEEPCLVIFNMLPSPIDDFVIGVPFSGRYKVLLNSDESVYGGSDYPIFADAHAVDELESCGEACGGMADSLLFRLPPLSTLIIKHVSEPV